MGSTDEVDYGRRLIPHLIDERANQDWKQPITSVSRSADPIDGFDDITYRQFANAINHCAWWMQTVLGTSHEHNAIAYTGPSDIRYGILTIAAIKTGFKVSHTFEWSSKSVEAESTIAVCSLAQKHSCGSPDPLGATTMRGIFDYP